MNPLMMAGQFGMQNPYIRQMAMQRAMMQNPMMGAQPPATPANSSAGDTTFKDVLAKLDGKPDAAPAAIAEPGQLAEAAFLEEQVYEELEQEDKDQVTKTAGIIAVVICIIICCCCILLAVGGYFVSTEGFLNAGDRDEMEKLRNQYNVICAGLALGLVFGTLYYFYGGP